MSEILFFIFLGTILFFAPKIIKKPELGLCFLVLSLPFERIPSYEAPFLWGVTIRLSQIIGLIIIITFLFNFLRGKIKFKLAVDYLLLSLYVLASLFSIIFAGDTKRAVMVWLFTVFVMAVSIAVSQFVKNKINIYKIEKYLFWVTLAVSLFGLFQFIGSTFGISDDWVLLRSTYGETTKRLLGFPRVQAFSLEPLYYANFLLIPFGVFLAKNFNKPEKNNYWLIFLIAVNFMLTFSRGIYFAGIITLIVSAILALKYSDYIKISKNILVISLGVITGILLLIGSSFYKNSNFSQIDKAKEHATEINEDSISVSERKDTWENAIVAFREKPLLGVGIGNFGPWEVGFPKEVPKGGWNIVNNETLEILAETGIIGFLALMSFLFYVFIQSASVFFSSSDKDLRIWAAGIVTAFIGVAVQYQTFSTLYIMHVWVLIGLMMSVTRLEKVNNN